MLIQALCYIFRDIIKISGNHIIDMEIIATESASDLECVFLNKDFKKRKIIFFTTDIETAQMDDHFVFMAKTARNLGHDVLLVTTCCEKSIIDKQLNPLRVYQIGRRIPKLILGGFYHPLYLLRTIYSTIWLIKRRRTLNPTFVVVQNASPVIPFLKLFGKLHIVQIQAFADLESSGGNPDFISSRQKLLHNFYIKHADEIIVQNKFAKTVFNQVFAEPTKSLAVLYPCVDTTAFERCPTTRLDYYIRVPNEAIIFVCFAPMRSSSNLDLVIRAFARLLNETRINEPFLYINMYLVIAGQYENTKDYADYATAMQFNALKLCHDRPSVVFLNGAPLIYRKALLNRCTGVLFPMLHSLNGSTILEAGLMRKPVLAAKSGIAIELIQEGVNGFLLEPTPVEFAKCMSSLVYSKQLEKERAIKIFTHFRKNYSLLRYCCEVENMVVRNSRHVLEEETYTSDLKF